MTIRRLLPSDAAAFQALRLRGLLEAPTAFSSSYEEEHDRPISAVAERIAENPDNAIFGAFDGESLVGVMGIYRMKQQKLSHTVTVWGVFVAPEYRGQGIARRLLEETVRFAFSLPGVLKVNLGVNDANTAAIKLYEAVGFKVFGHEKGFMLVDGVLYDELHMARMREDQPS